jgi:transmembrane sensor
MSTRDSHSSGRREHEPRRSASLTGDEAGDSALDWARDVGEANHVIRELDQFLQRRKKRRVRAAVAGAVSCITVLLGLSVVRSRPQVSPSVADVRESGSQGLVVQPERRVLPDGSTVELNAGAEITVDFAGPLRRVALRRGEAHFQVVKDPQRAFIVAAGGVEVRAVGTAFAVELNAGEIEVVVTEGRVAVEKPVNSQPAAPVGAAGATPSAPPVAAEKLAQLDVGHRFVVPRATDGAMLPPSALTPEEVARRLAWRVPRLEFAATPLHQALAMFNEHGRVRLVLGDAALRDLKVSGVLRADNTDSLLRLLEGEFGLSAERRGDDLVLRRR